MALRVEQSACAQELRFALSSREIEILALIAKGQRTAQVADSLFLSKRTVEYHLANVFFKLKVNNRIQAILEANRLGMIPSNPLVNSSHRAIELELVSDCPELRTASHSLTRGSASQNGHARR